MATRDKGPVKPPVLDLEARKKDDAAGKTADAKTTAGTKSAGATPGGSGNAKSGTGEKPAGKSASSPLRATNLLIPAAAGLGGALAGAAIAYGIAFAGFWPQQESRLPAALAADLAALETAIANTGSTNTAQQQALETLSGRIDELTSALDTGLASIPEIPPDEPVDLTPLQARLDDLETRIEAVASGASGEQASGLAEDLTALRTELAAMTERLAAAEQAAATASAQADGLRDEIAGLAETARAGTAGSSAALQVPLALSGFEAAIGAGRPFAAELDALRTALPGLDIPQAVAANAASGLPSPEDAASRFARAIPAMLAAKPAGPDTGWQDALIHRARALLAMRPAEAVDGDTPEALISRIEAALAHEDFVTARQTFAGLPQPMQNAAGDAGTMIANLAEAQAFAASARAAALAPAGNGGDAS